MGVFYMMEAPALIDDIPIDFQVSEIDSHHWQYVREKYYECALTCFFAMACYLVTFTLSIVMFVVNKYVVKSQNI